MPAIYSTLANDTTYQLFDKKDPRNPVLKGAVTIKGGAGVQHKKTLETPRGFATVVSVDDLKLLKENHVFKIHLDNGYIAIDEKENSKPSEDEIDEKVDDEMTEKDNSAQDTKEDYIKKGKKPPKED